MVYQYLYSVTYYLYVRFDVASRVADNDESKFIGENMEPVPSHLEGKEAIVIEDLKKTFTAFRDECCFVISVLKKHSYCLEHDANLSL